MSMITGAFDDSGCPTIKLKIGGVLDPSEFEAIVDTGFSGFLSMPVIKAFPLGLPLYGTTSVVLADGETQYKLTAQAKVTVGSITKIGVVILEFSSTAVLVGMDFLRTFQLSLVATTKWVIFLEESKMTEILEGEDEPGDSGGH